MTNTLKQRFVIFTMTAVTLLLIFIVVAINGLNLLMLERQSDAVMDTLLESEGHFQKMHFNPPPPFSPPLNMDKMHSSRFFIVSSDLNGNILEVNTTQISSIDPATAEKYAIWVANSGKISGKIEGYKFAVKERGDKKLFFFMDNSRQTDY